MITVKGNSAIYEGPTIDEMYTTGIDVNTLFHELNTNKWYYLTADTTWVEVPNTGGGSSFTPTEEQLAAMNSGATTEKINQIATNQSNISSVQTELTTNQNDGFTKNSQIFDIEKWRTVGTHNGNTVINSDNSVTITATASDCYTGYTPNGTPNYPEQAKISVSQGDKIYMTWTSDSDEQKGRVFIFGNADTTKTVNAYNNAGSLTYNVPSGVTFITFRLGVTTSGNSLTYSNIMISKQQGATYQQYTPSNRELYEMILNL